jgi:hypothetical protein
MSAESLEEGRELMTAEAGTVALLAKGEIDMQIATAHRYPRSIKQFRNDVLDMVTLSEQIAQECIYALPRDGKMVEGPSARFAEVVASAWGNSRAGARVVNDQGDFVTAQGVFHDLQKNVAITYEVQRRITDKHGRRYKPDMIGVTANAACSIALRNAILKGVPKAFWTEMYDAARRTAMGDVKTLPTRRADAFKAFQNFGVTKDQVLAKLNLKGEEDIGQEELLVLRGILTAIKDGDTTPEQAFAPEDGAAIVAQPKAKSDKKPVDPPAQDSAAQATEPVKSTVEQNTATQERTADVSAPAAAEPGAPVSESVLRVLKTKMEAAALGEADLRKKFGHGYDGVTKEGYAVIVDWVSNPAG